MTTEMRLSIHSYVLNNIERVSPFLLNDKHYGFKDVGDMLEIMKNDDTVLTWAYYQILVQALPKEYLYRLFTSILWK